MVAKAKRRFRWPPRSAAWPGRGQGGHRSRRTANQLEPRFSIVGFSQLPAIREVARRECPIVGQPEYIPRNKLADFLVVAPCPLLLCARLPGGGDDDLRSRSVHFSSIGLSDSPARFVLGQTPSKEFGIAVQQTSGDQPRPPCIVRRCHTGRRPARNRDQPWERSSARLDRIRQNDKTDPRRGSQVCFASSQRTV